MQPFLVLEAIFLLIILLRSCIQMGKYFWSSSCSSLFSKSSQSNRWNKLYIYTYFALFNSRHYLFTAFKYLKLMVFLVLHVFNPHAADLFSTQTVNQVFCKHMNIDSDSRLYYCKLNAYNIIIYFFQQTCFQTHQSSLFYTIEREKICVHCPLD